jgi:uncharacterized Fe-S center protein
MKSDVYYFTARSRTYEGSMSKVKGPLALEKLGFKDKVKSGNKVVIKTHFGALENTRYLRPSYLRFLSLVVGDYLSPFQECIQNIVDEEMKRNISERL